MNELCVSRIPDKVAHDNVEQIAHRQRPEAEALGSEREAAKELTDLARQIDAKKPSLG